MQHLKLKSLVAVSLAWLLGSGLAWAQDASSANVARVSFVQGSVQLLAGQGSDFQQAVINMPVLDGSRLQAGGDGQAEIEFGDGSVARLTPNSTIQFDHLGEDRVQLEQMSGLAYYEFNVGDGHPPFSVQFGNLYVEPTANSIVRVGLDSGWDVAVISGAVSLQGQGIQAVTAAENQSIRSAADSGAPYALAQGVNQDSWDNWNQDRDQAIAQEASQQTPVRDDSANPQSENWNDLDADGNWYPVEGAGNVWVPAGVGPGWDPYGAGYWGYYPTLGYTWISSYPWGWLPYHCGAWSYYGFGWGWAPGGCGRVWSPVTVVRAHPPGWTMPIRPIYPPGGARPLPGRLVAVDRGPVAKGPWAFGYGTVPRPDHQASLNFNGRAITPVDRTNVHTEGLSTARGTAPGSRAVLSGPTSSSFSQRVNPSSAYVGGSPGLVRPPQAVNERPPVGYPSGQSYNQRSTYVPRETPTPHYSSPPPPHYSAPPSAPSHMSAPSGGHR